MEIEALPGPKTTHFAPAPRPGRPGPRAPAPKRPRSRPAPATPRRAARRARDPRCPAPSRGDAGVAIHAVGWWRGPAPPRRRLGVLQERTRAGDSSDSSKLEGDVRAHRRSRPEWHTYRGGRDL